MPRDLHHRPKHEGTRWDHPLMQMLAVWNSRVAVPRLANQAARVEIAGRRLLHGAGESRDRVAARYAEQPFGLLLAIAGIGFLLGNLAERRRR